MLLRPPQDSTVVLTDNPCRHCRVRRRPLPAVTDFNSFIESFVAPLSWSTLILSVALHDEQRTWRCAARGPVAQQLYDSPSTSIGEYVAGNTFGNVACCL